MEHNNAGGPEADAGQDAAERHPFVEVGNGVDMAMLLTDPNLPDNPIVFANEAFTKMTGHEPDGLHGSNCRKLQGPGTDPAAVQLIREAIELRKPINIDLLNYRQDGTPFWNALHISPVCDTEDNLRYFFALQVDVTEQVHARRALERRLAALADAGAAATETERQKVRNEAELVRGIGEQVKSNMAMVSALVSMRAQALADTGLREVLQSDLPQPIGLFGNN